MTRVLSSSATSYVNFIKVCTNVLLLIYYLFFFLFYKPTYVVYIRVETDRERKLYSFEFRPRLMKNILIIVLMLLLMYYKNMELINEKKKNQNVYKFETFNYFILKLSYTYNHLLSPFNC